MKLPKGTHPVVRKFYDLNPNFSLDSQLKWREDGRLEFICKHGIGHTVFSPHGDDFVHGCDGCCKGITCVMPEDLK